MATRFRALSAIFLSLVATMLLVTGCHTGRTTQTVSSPPETFPASTVMSHVLVAGAPADLKLFNDRMSQIENVTNLEDAFIACPKCGLLGSATPPSELDYYYAVAHVMKPRKFIDAWSAVTSTGIKISAKFDDNLTGLGVAACPPSPPAPLCFSAPWCWRTSNCDKDTGTSGCQVCQ